MTVIKAVVLSSLYQDSVVLMRIAREVRAMDGVDEVAAFMGTPANHAILEASGMATPAALESGGNDLIISVRADTDATADQALVSAREQLAGRRVSADQAETRPKTMDAALKKMPDANLALISVPGPYVRFEARRALSKGLNVMIFSDNVPIADEVELKRHASERGLLCMGPDCGTAYINGKGLAFHNVVGRGRVGCVAASGTGLQAVAARLDALDEGISYGIGVGGRDLSAEVGGIMTFDALRFLAQDDATEAIVVISKTPSAALLEPLENALLSTGKPTIAVCIGTSRPSRDNVAWVRTLDGAANTASALLNGGGRGRLFADPAGVRESLDAVADSSLQDRPVMGFFSGGTLAQEAIAQLEPLIGKIGTELANTTGRAGHLILDLGDDKFTVGRPHPMIEPEVRTEVMLREIERRQPGVVLFDIVLGKGAHDSPGAAIAETLTTLQRSRGADQGFAAVAAVIGTRRDPQGLEPQMALLRDAGATVFTSNTEAANFTAMLVDPTLREGILNQ